MAKDDWIMFFTQQKDWFHAETLFPS